MLLSRLRVVATYKATRVDIGGLKSRVEALWSTPARQRMFLGRLERDWVVFSLTSDPHALPSLASTGSTPLPACFTFSIAYKCDSRDVAPP